MYVVLYVHSSFSSVRVLTLELLCASRTLLKTEQATYASWSTTAVPYIATTCKLRHLRVQYTCLAINCLSLSMCFPSIVFSTLLCPSWLAVFHRSSMCLMLGCLPKGTGTGREYVHIALSPPQWFGIEVGSEESLLYILYIKWTNTVFSRAHLMLNGKTLQCVNDDEKKRKMTTIVNIVVKMATLTPQTAPFWGILTKIPPK